MTYELVFRLDAADPVAVRDLADGFRDALDKAHRRDPDSYPCRIVGHAVSGPLTNERMVAARHREDLAARR